MRVCVICVCVCVFACVCFFSVALCVCDFFKNIYLQQVPIHVNITCSSFHVIHCLPLWSVFVTTGGDIFRNMNNYHQCLIIN